MKFIVRMLEEILLRAIGSLASVVSVSNFAKFATTAKTDVDLTIKI